ncbi:alpha/beta hydrolase [Tardiphaga sp.]|uniref:alpha/beta fold hydrolase n=1 Tax=Tardiphaga sp. TaxID=1926292 RepID=UPI00261D773C|nr:alpha/beta hydrolase [Tardiphaga sp.]MDB5619935.1 hypothetical protein [Tardiphaga sp.]
MKFHHREGRQPTVVLVHGNSSSSAVWQPLIRCLPDQAVLSFDLRGHGESGWAEPPAYSTKDYADDIGELLDRVGIDDFILVGHSNGALSSAYFAARHQPSPKALVYIDIAPKVPQAQIDYFHARASGVSRVWTSLDKLTSTMNAADPTVPGALFMTYLADFAEAVEGGIRQKLDPQTFGAWSPADVWADLESLDIPLFLVRGETSRVLSRENAEEMQSRMPKAHFEVIDGAGHFLMLAQPESLANVIRAALSAVSE